jgi:phytoene dehydrogenase-like protein
MNPISSASSAVLASSAAFNSASLGVVSAANGGGGALASAIVGQAEAGVQLQAAAQVEQVSEALSSALVDITV